MSNAWRLKVFDLVDKRNSNRYTALAKKDAFSISVPEAIFLDDLENHFYNFYWFINKINSFNNEIFWHCGLQ